MRVFWPVLSSSQAGSFLLSRGGFWANHFPGENLQADMPMNEPPIRKGRGCCFYGCLGSAVLALVLAVGVVLGVRYYVRSTLIKYSDVAPVALPQVEASPADLKAVQEQVTAFKKAIETGQPAEPLNLDERALNLLLANTPELKALADKVHLAIEGNEIKGQISFPLDQLPLFRVPGRYINGSATFKVSLDNGVLIVTPQSVEVKGAPLPEEIMAGLRTQNFARDIYSDPRVAETLRQLDRIEVKDGRITVRAAQPESKPSPERPE